MRYRVVIEEGEDHYAARVPELPGCVATGATVEEVQRAIRDAIAFHLACEEMGWRPRRPRPNPST